VLKEGGASGTALFLSEWHSHTVYINRGWHYAHHRSPGRSVFYPYSDVRTLFHLRQLNYKAANHFLLFHAAYAKLSIVTLFY
jgi:hypothetical protein